MNEFTSEEISLLIKAIDSIEKARSLGRSFGTVLGGMFQKEENINSFIEKEEKKEELEKMKFAKETEDCIMLKAKLINMHRQLDAYAANRILNDAKR